MDFLKAELERKKKQLSKNEVTGSGKKYFKRGDLMAKQEEDYWNRHSKSKNISPEKAPEEENTDVQTAGTSQGKELTLSRDEVIKRLRERGEPVLLFGESELEAFQRLRILEIQAPEVNQGFRNDFKDAMDKVDKDYLSELLKSHNEGDDETKKGDIKVFGDDIKFEDIMEKAEDFGNKDDNTDCDVILMYLKAADYYLQMAIGNAPWPIGVTMVGIHARTGREKIFSQQIAHVLNDETQRKYIQGLKRLMTICQRNFPTTPSRSVEYNA
ncbi:pre-mRNA-splicing factor 18-like [Saccoglossus kowalevskii]